MIKLEITPKTLYYTLSGLIVLLTLMAIGSTIIGYKMLTEQNKKLTHLKIENEVLAEQEQALIQAKNDLEKYAELEQIIKQVVPQEKDQVRTIREVIKFANESGVEIGSITFPGSELGTGGNIKLTQLSPVEGLNGVYNLEISVSVDSPTEFAQMISFMRKLESNRRTSQISNITIIPNPQNRNVLTFVITFNAFVRPQG